MKTKSRFTFCFCILHLSFCLSLHAQGTAFTYQGRLNDNGASANGIYDLTFALFDAASAGGQIPGPVTTNDVAVSNGLFTVKLDFGPSAAAKFSGADRWLEISVRTNGGGAFTALTPRQQVTSTPYALRAANFTGAVSVSQLPPEVAMLASNQTFSGAVKLTNVANVIAGNGAGLTNVSIGALSASLPAGQFLQALSLLGLEVGHNIVPADVNADGRLDLVVGSGLTPAAVVFTNDGNRGFIATVPPAPGVHDTAHYVMVGDFNGDGRPDFARSEDWPSGNTLVILTNNGDGVFAEASSLALSRPALGVSADFNGDGRRDLAIASPFNNSVYVLTNAGNAIFVSAGTLAVTGTPTGLTASDLNNDGRPDLVTANSGAGTLTVLTNSGNAAFAALTNAPAGTGARSVCAADVNGDGWLDLISANNGAGTLSVLTNSSGAFVTAATLSVSSPRGVSAADVNADGLADVFCASDALNSAVIFTNNGSSGFPLAATLGTGNAPFAIAAGDFSGDGRIDLALAGNTALLTILFNRNYTDVSLAPPSVLDFGAGTRQMITLYSGGSGGSTFGFGVQAGTLYTRCDAGSAFAWYAGGVHNNDALSSGGGSVRMVLNGGGLTVNGTFVSGSDRNSKENFRMVSPDEVLEKVLSLPISEWNYKESPTTRHLGPMAQDFHAAFEIGSDDKHIATVDADGVALAAIQGLNEKVEKQARIIAAKDAEIADLERRLSRLEKMISFSAEKR